MKRKTLVLFAGLGFIASQATAATILFDFDTAPLHVGLPLDQTADGITARLSATGSGFSIQEANTLGFTPGGFSGYCIYPNSIYAADLMVRFSDVNGAPALMSGFSILYAPEEYATDSSCTMRVTAYMGSTFVDSSTYSIDPPGTWPSGTLSISTTSPFDNVVVHYDRAPVTGGDYGPIFMADNLRVTTAQVSVPDTLSTGLALLLLALGFVGAEVVGRCRPVGLRPIAFSRKNSRA